MHHWLKIDVGFAGPDKKGGLPRHKFMSKQTSLLCIMVELTGLGSAFSRVTPSRVCLIPVANSGRKADETITDIYILEHK